MPPNAPPTARRRRLGTELRRLRERAGMTATNAAALISANQSRISNIEAGRYGVSAERVRALAANYECVDKALVEALAGMTGERGRRGWWEEYRDRLPARMLDLAELEHHGHRLRTAHIANLPGLLQTFEHARAVCRQVVPELSPPEVEHRASFRIKRQTVLFREDPVPYQAVLHEAGLRMQFGGRATARAQLKHLLAMSEREHITLLVIPFAAGAFAGSTQPLYYVHGAVPQLDTVQLDQSHGPVFLDAEAQLDKYRLVLERLTATALDPKKSQDFIHSIVRDL
ncbi:helix-turn-helix transcriptional regulator [Streptomyces sp. MUM 203J]|uniref:helix-turn-helix domain-containing protein n=1 Tax=Streptomyces sp. MUM 203J TaxID=2791990 RepID=UPI001F04B2EA|nr:helix-turn-helix transcriptional regulator [Streptomyces sp. MUM 203J]MCH0538500.1 helix-turn-helix transcriptional regulator [Streptomyces sp. MUM 203J]